MYILLDHQTALQYSEKLLSEAVKPDSFLWPPLPLRISHTIATVTNGNAQNTEKFTWSWLKCNAVQCCFQKLYNQIHFFGRHFHWQDKLAIFAKYQPQQNLHFKCTIFHFSIPDKIIIWCRVESIVRREGDCERGEDKEKMVKICS